MKPDVSSPASGGGESSRFRGCPVVLKRIMYIIIIITIYAWFFSGDLNRNFPLL